MSKQEKQNQQEQLENLARVISSETQRFSDDSADFYKSLILAHVTAHGLPTGPKTINTFLNNINLLHAKSMAYCLERAAEDRENATKKFVSAAKNFFQQAHDNQLYEESYN